MEKDSFKQEDTNDPVIANAQTLQYGRDLARLFKAEKAEKENFQSLFNLSPDGIIILGEDQEILATNPALLKLLYEKQDTNLVGKRVTEFIKPEEIDKTLSKLKITISGKTQHEKFETTLIRSNGGSFPAEISMGKISWEQQPAVQIILRDITEQKHAIALLEQRVDERTQKLSVLYAIASNSNKTQDIALTLTQSLEILIQAVNIQAGIIFIQDQGSRENDLIVSYGMLSEEFDNANKWLSKKNVLEIILTEGISKHYSNNIIKGTIFRSYIGIPILGRGNIIGVMNLFSHDAYNFQNDLDLCKSIADQLGVIIRNSRLSERVKKTVVVEERNRMARELHDSVTQLIYSLTLFSSAGLKLLRSKKWSRVDEYLIKLSQTAEQALKEMRLMIFELRPAQFQDFDVIQSIKNRLDSVETRAGIIAKLSVDQWKSPPKHIASEIFKIFQEALNNSLKYSNAKHVWINALANLESLVIEMTDDGIGFDYSSAQEGGGMGLQNMIERAHQMGGELIINTELNMGTIIKLTVPLIEENSESGEV